MYVVMPWTICNFETVPMQFTDAVVPDNTINILQHTMLDTAISTSKYFGENVFET